MTLKATSGSQRHQVWSVGDLLTKWTLDSWIRRSLYKNRGLVKIGTCGTEPVKDASKSNQGSHTSLKSSGISRTSWRLRHNAIWTCRVSNKTRMMLSFLATTPLAASLIHESCYTNFALFLPFNHFSSDLDPRSSINHRGLVVCYIHTVMDRTLHLERAIH